MTHETTPAFSYLSRASLLVPPTVSAVPQMLPFYILFVLFLLFLTYIVRVRGQRSGGKGRLTGSSFSSVWNTRSVTTVFVVNGISFPSGQERGMREDERSQWCWWW